MIALIIKSYLAILLSVGIGSLTLFILGVYFIFSRVGKAPDAKTERPRNASESDIIFPTGDLPDVSAIAGDDVLNTQLDLARAFIETGNKGSAKAILKRVARQGNAAQQQEAQRLSQLA